MITFLSSPKAFTGYTGKIQCRAIRSWLGIHPLVEVIIYGDGEGVAEACGEMYVRHVPEIPCTPSGIPYFNDIVEHARIHARNDVQCYLNCDIMMKEEMIKAIQVLEFPRYLVIGQRIDLAEEVDYDVTAGNWKLDVLKFAERGQAHLHESTGMDYFIFPRGMWDGLRPLVIGRAGYDGALVAFCFRNKIPLINGTLAIPALHQFHDYGHVQGGRETVLMGRDAKNNILLHNIKHSVPDSADAHWVIVNGALIPNVIQRDLLRRIELALRFDMGCEILSLAVKVLWRIAVASGIHRVRLLTIQDILGSNPYNRINKRRILWTDERRK